MRVTCAFASAQLRTDDLAFSRVVRALTEVGVYVNRLHLRANRKAPSLYDAGIVYRAEPPGVEELVDIPALLRRGHGDCMQLVAWRVAELREQGERASVALTRPKRSHNRRYFHVVVRRANGKTEDPSRLLGM